jgi:hypothetical protein
VTHDKYVAYVNCGLILKFIFRFFFGGNSRTVALRQIKLGTVNDQDILFELLFCLTKILNLWMVGNCEVTLRKTVYYCE